jgi:hypothetical protein
LFSKIPEKNELLSSCSFLGWLFAITLVEAINASCGVDQFLLSSEKRVTGGADFNVEVTFTRGPSLKRLATGTGDSDFGVFRVYSRFHYFFSRSLL